MRTLCAWCGVTLADGPPKPVSHGICPVCRARVFPEEWTGRDAPACANCHDSGLDVSSGEPCVRCNP